MAKSVQEYLWDLETEFTKGTLISLVNLHRNRKTKNTQTKTKPTTKASHLQNFQRIKKKKKNPNQSTAKKNIFNGSWSKYFKTKFQADQENALLGVILF